MDRIKLVRNDNLPRMVVTLTDEATDEPIDLSGVTTAINVRFRKQGSTEVLSTIPCSKVTSGADGKVTFSFAGSTLDVEPGLYEGEVEIDFNGDKQTVYDVMKFKVRDEFG